MHIHKYLTHLLYIYILTEHSKDIITIIILITIIKWVKYRFAHNADYDLNDRMLCHRSSDWFISSLFPFVSFGISSSF
jgi:hypothetical protein